MYNKTPQKKSKSLAFCTTELHQNDVISLPDATTCQSHNEIFVKRQQKKKKIESQIEKLFCVWMCEKCSSSRLSYHKSIVREDKAKQSLDFSILSACT